jgi:MFS family permease
VRFPPALRHRQFRLIWIGMAVSIAGSQMQLWALFWHVRELTELPIALGGIGLARIVPIIFFSLIGGAVADVANRRKVMFITQTLMASTSLTLTYLTLTGQTSLWHIYLLTAIQAVGISFDTPARQSLIPNLVPARDLPNAFSLQSISFQTGAIVGPAVGGLVIGYLGLPFAYLINSISFGAVILSLLLMGPVKQHILNPQRANPISLRSIAEGINFIKSSPIILSTMVVDFLATFFSSANTLMPIMARDILRVSEIHYGWLSAGQAIGAMAAAAIISQITAIRRQGRIFLISVVAFGAATILFGLSRTFPLALFSLVLIGASDSVSTIIRNTIRQLQTPDHIRGRMVSVNQIFFMGGPQLGEVESGVVAQFFGVPFAIVSGGIAAILIVLLVASRWPQLKSFNGDEPIPQGTPAD